MVFMMEKDSGNFEYSIDGGEKISSTIGLGHTRWATHGKPSKENSHPHMDNSNTFSVVHNGIIENYNELRKELGLSQEKLANNCELDRTYVASVENGKRNISIITNSEKATPTLTVKTACS